MPPLMTSTPLTAEGVESAGPLVPVEDPLHHPGRAARDDDNHAVPDPEGQHQRRRQHQGISPAAR